MRLVDTHAHLDEQAFQTDLPDVLARAEAVGLVAIVSLGTTAESSATMVELARQHPLIHAGVGIHPNYAAQAQPGDWEKIEQLAASPKVVAIGETGLDRYWDYTPFEVQIDYFQRQLDLSRRTGLPFVVHCREAEPDVLRELQQAATHGPLNGVMHSFCGSPATLETCLELGMMISFAGMLTFKKNTDLRALAATVPHDRLMIETDAPYLAPEPNRGKRNEPAYVEYTAKTFADALGMTKQELGELTTSNAKRFFKLGD